VLEETLEEQYERFCEEKKLAEESWPEQARQRDGEQQRLVQLRDHDEGQ